MESLSINTLKIQYFLDISEICKNDLISLLITGRNKVESLVICAWLFSGNKSVYRHYPTLMVGGDEGVLLVGVLQEHHHVAQHHHAH